VVSKAECDRLNLAQQTKTKNASAHSDTDGMEIGDIQQCFKSNTTVVDNGKIFPSLQTFRV